MVSKETTQLSTGEGVITLENKEKVAKEHPISVLQDIANILRLECVEMTSIAKSG